MRIITQFFKRTSLKWYTVQWCTYYLNGIRYIASHLCYVKNSEKQIKCWTVIWIRQPKCFTDYHRSEEVGWLEICKLWKAQITTAVGYSWRSISAHLFSTRRASGLLKFHIRFGEFIMRPLTNFSRIKLIEYFFNVLWDIIWFTFFRHDTCSFWKLTGNSPAWSYTVQLPKQLCFSRFW